MLLAEEGQVAKPIDGKPKTDPPVTLVVYQPDGHDIACAVRLEEFSQHGDPGSVHGSRTREESSPPFQWCGNQPECCDESPKMIVHIG